MRLLPYSQYHPSTVWNHFRLSSHQFISPPAHSGNYCSQYWMVIVLVIVAAAPIFHFPCWSLSSHTFTLERFQYTARRVFYIGQCKAHVDYSAIWRCRGALAKMEEEAGIVSNNIKRTVVCRSWARLKQRIARFSFIRLNIRWLNVFRFQWECEVYYLG